MGKVLVREFRLEATDLDAVWRVAQAVYPDLYGDVSEADRPALENYDKAWIVELGGDVVGFAFCIDRIFTDIALLPEFRRYTMPLLWKVWRWIRAKGGVWEARCRVTSYALLKQLEVAGKIKIEGNTPIDEIGKGRRYYVSFRVLS